MEITGLQNTWDQLGKDDPLWAIISREDKKGGKWSVDEFFATGEKEIGDVMRYVDALPRKFARSNALDFGCGIGRVTQPLAKYFNEVTGVDIAASMIALAKQYNTHGDRCIYIHNKTGDLQAFTDDNFDFIYTNITLQHMEPRFAKKYIQEFLRVLTPHGILIFQLPSHIKVTNIRTLILRLVPKMMVRAWYRLWSGTQPRIDMNGIRRDDVVSFLKQNGAIILDVAPDQSAGKDWASYRYCATKN